jgi:hypothetical protein
MITTASVTKSHLNKLSDEVLNLIGMGQYTLYRIEAKAVPDISYVLRTGETELFFLKDDGEPVEVSEPTQFDIHEKIVIDDVDVAAVVPNFSKL